jgi:integrase
MTAQQVQRLNHPKKGECITVSPIRSLEEIAEIKDYLKDRPRDLALFVVGVNTNLRASDLVSLKVGDVRGLAPGDLFLVKIRKTKKVIRVTMNRAVCDAIAPLLQGSEDDFVFRSQRGGPLTVPAVSRMVKGWCRDCGLKGNFAAHSMRKTHGYIHRIHFGTGLPTLMDMFGHANEKQTLHYLGIQREEVRDAYMREI